MTTDNNGGQETRLTIDRDRILNTGRTKLEWLLDYLSQERTDFERHYALGAVVEGIANLALSTHMPGLERAYGEVVASNTAHMQDWIVVATALDIPPAEFASANLHTLVARNICALKAHTKAWKQVSDYMGKIGWLTSDCHTVADTVVHSLKQASICANARHEQNVKILKLTTQNNALLDKVQKLEEAVNAATHVHIRSEFEDASTPSATPDLPPPGQVKSVAADSLPPPTTQPSIAAESGFSESEILSNRISKAAAKFASDNFVALGPNITLLVTNAMLIGANIAIQREREKLIAATRQL